MLLKLIKVQCFHFISPFFIVQYNCSNKFKLLATCFLVIYIDVIHKVHFVYSRSSFIVFLVNIKLFNDIHSCYFEICSISFVCIVNKHHFLTLQNSGSWMHCLFKLFVLWYLLSVYIWLSTEYSLCRLISTSAFTILDSARI